ncbi:CPBP family intramembrane glutamic endopeptidase [Butyrivibrio sp. YAB3001]|uniref:CPBP family intramembrane glutamic endopeptidase n=1 Tax=Butyrivibrio sp. YAB3001 TaxID=1520812 RepID=UPI00158825CF|nr:CPBP family intramembrane glutamic endopeptidase [Butyrivibrio sp. YAB3001]
MRRLYIPLAWELLFVVSTIIMPKQSFHLFFIFYLGLLIYYYYFHKQFSFRKFSRNLKRIKRFWIPVIITFFGLLIASQIKNRLILPNFYAVKDGTISIITRNDIIPTIFYAMMMIIMKPVAEELFFRKAIISFGSRKKVFLLSVASLILCAVSRAHGLLGIAEWMLMGIPVTIAYVVTRNIYISVMAHVAFEFYDNIYSIVYAIGRILNR